MDWPFKVMKWAPLVAVLAIGGNIAIVAFTNPSALRSRSVDKAAAREKSVGAAASCKKVRNSTMVGATWNGDVRPGPYRRSAKKVTGVRADGSIELSREDEAKTRDGLRKTLHESRLRKFGKASLSERYARTAANPFNTAEAKKNKTGVHVGDVFVSGLPMIDQGDKAYCAVASAARVLQGYGIEVTMDDLAHLANSSPTGGTAIPSWEEAIRDVVRSHGLDLMVIPELTESMHPLGNIIQEYNYTARKMGSEDLNCWDYIGTDKTGALVEDYASYWQDYDYAVRREALLSNSRACDAFDENVINCIDESDPLFWSVNLGDVAEQPACSPSNGENRSAHMRLIIGYNEDDGEILYTDSWGPGHELKRMDASDALSITKGMFYLKDNPGEGSASKVEVVEE